MKFGRIRPSATDYSNRGFAKFDQAAKEADKLFSFPLSCRYQWFM